MLIFTMGVIKTESRLIERINRYFSKQRYEELVYGVFPLLVNT